MLSSFYNVSLCICNFYFNKFGIINSYNDAIIELWINLIFDLWKLLKGLNIFIITFAYFPRVDVRFVYYSLFINIIISRNIFIHFFICFFIRILFSLALISHWILVLYVVFVTSQTEIKSLIIMIITTTIIIRRRICIVNLGHFHNMFRALLQQ